MGGHSNITPDNYAPCGPARFAAARPHNWRYVQVHTCQGALFAHPVRCGWRRICPSARCARAKSSAFSRVGVVTRGASDVLVPADAVEAGDPASARARYVFQSRLQRVFGNADEVRRGPWRGQGPGGVEGEVLFFRRGYDVVVTTPGGAFVTFLQGGATNSRFLGASVVP
jgi:hypothetical protein